MLMKLNNKVCSYRFSFSAVEIHVFFKELKKPVQVFFKNPICFKITLLVSDWRKKYKTEPLLSHSSSTSPH